MNKYMRQLCMVCLVTTINLTHAMAPFEKTLETAQKKGFPSESLRVLDAIKAKVPAATREAVGDRMLGMALRKAGYDNIEQIFNQLKTGPQMREQEEQEYKTQIYNLKSQLSQALQLRAQLEQQQRRMSEQANQANQSAAYWKDSHNQLIQQMRAPQVQQNELKNEHVLMSDLKPIKYQPTISVWQEIKVTLLGDNFKGHIQAINENMEQYLQNRSCSALDEVLRILNGMDAEINTVVPPVERTEALDRFKKMSSDIAKYLNP